MSWTGPASPERAWMRRASTRADNASRSPLQIRKHTSQRFPGETLLPASDMTASPVSANHIAELDRCGPPAGCQAATSGMSASHIAELDQFGPPACL